MFAQDISMNMLCIYPQVTRQQGTKTSRVQRRASADHPVGRDSKLSRVECSQVSHHINGVRRDE